MVRKAKGKGRGHWGHKGRKGKRGGSVPSKGVAGALTHRTVVSKVLTKAGFSKISPGVGRGGFESKAWAKGDKRKEAVNALVGAGFEKYGDPMYAKDITSLKREKLSAHIQLYQGKTFVNVVDREKSRVKPPSGKEHYVHYD